MLFSSTFSRVALLTPALLASLLSLSISSCSSITGKSSGTKRPDPKRFAGEIEKFARHDKETPFRKGGIVFTGSSSIRLWDVKRSFPDLPVLNRGFGGSVANDLVVYKNRVAIRHEPKVLVVYTGSNDLHVKMTPEEVMTDYTEFLNEVHRQVPQTVVIVNSVKISRSRLKEIPEVERTNALLKDWCATRRWTVWLDSHGYLKDADGQPRDEFFRKDQLHLNEKGYDKWSAILGPVLREEWAKPARMNRRTMKNPWAK